MCFISYISFCIVFSLLFLLFCLFFFFFFFSSRRRHTRFDCDWSSDVCSSDLVFRTGALLLCQPSAKWSGWRELHSRLPRSRRGCLLLTYTLSRRTRRSEERRVGKECRSRWSPEH